MGRPCRTSEETLMDTSKNSQPHSKPKPLNHVLCEGCTYPNQTAIQRDHLVSRQCKIEPCKPCICMLWTPLPKHWPTQTRMGFGRNGVVRMQWSNARRCSRIARDRNGYWKETSNPALTKSATHGC